MIYVVLLKAVQGPPELVDDLAPEPVFRMDQRVASSVVIVEVLKTEVAFQYGTAPREGDVHRQNAVSQDTAGFPDTAEFPRVAMQSLGSAFLRTTLHYLTAVL